MGAKRNYLPGINSDASDSLADVRLVDNLHNFDIPILLDDSQLVAESLGLSKAGEIVVLKPLGGQILYRGGLDTDPVRARPALNIESVAGTTIFADVLSAALSMMLPHRANDHYRCGRL